jgi:hypothetical protein
MLDPHFKSLQVVENYVSCRDYIFLTFKSDANVIILLPMMIFEVLHSIVQACVAIVVGFGDFIKKDNNIFDVCASMEKFLHALVVGEFFCS